ncbi:hypothetical protein J2129_000119 [Methanofollis sp. W23]|nr:hypothetical protein [Methanofollis sp. W23]
MKLIPKIGSVMLNEDCTTPHSCMDLKHRIQKHFQINWFCRNPLGESLWRGGLPPPELPTTR